MEKEQTSEQIKNLISKMNYHNKEYYRCEKLIRQLEDQLVINCNHVMEIDHGNYSPGRTHKKCTKCPYFC